MNRRILLITFVLLSPVRGWATTIDFGRDVRPILSDKCYFCHGPDEANRQAGFRLDRRDEALSILESGELVERITHAEVDVVMPPPESNLRLTEPEKQILKAWVEQGAPYSGHWSFEPLPASVPVPNPKGSEWCREPLDRFVLEQIQRVGARPRPPADPLRWLRRVAMDLTGLPPTTDTIELFQRELAIDSDWARERVVANLLASPSFGEHFAVAWLDAVRYADSYGYQSDKLNTQWPYRDWVIAALNDNLPYDEFLTWQIAGDLLDAPTRSQRLATAFHRLHRLNNEGGAVFEEWRLENVADRVSTFGTVVLGLTMECCRCHDHKYDPISTRDFYSLSAFFNSIDESGVYDRTEKVPSPSLLLPTPEQEHHWRASQAQLAAAEKHHATTIAVAQRRYDTWAAKATPVGNKSTPIPDLKLALGFDQDWTKEIEKVYFPSQLDRSRGTALELIAVEQCDVPRLDPATAAETAIVPGDVARRALHTDGDRGITTRGVAPFDRWTPFSVVVTMRLGRTTAVPNVIAHHSRGTDCGYNGWDLMIQDGHLESRLYREWPGNAIGVRSVAPIPIERWHQITATFDGSSRASGLKLYLDGEPLAVTVLRDKLQKSCNVAVDHGGEFIVGQRFRSQGLVDALIDDVRVYERDLTQAELRHLATGEPIVATLDYFRSALDEPSRQSKRELVEARRSVVMAEEAMNEIPVMEATPPRPTHVLARGEYDAPTSDATLVSRDVPTGLGLPFPEHSPRDRRGLAAWVTDPTHPLTARVAVNRWWGHFFGKPLVRTPENFGLQGEMPTHPELLDYLARDFVHGDWDLKRLCRQIVLSSTYQQDSAASPEQRALDPENRLLARGPSHRLSAEQIRDLALAASGLLAAEPFGPPVSPYQPGGDLWREANGMSPPYQQSVGRALHRRSLYSVWKRTAPLPNMMAFDMSTREVCKVDRSRTNTPMQALVLLNDPQFVEAARCLAEQIVGMNNDAAKVDTAMVRLVGRTADPSERSVLLQLLRDEREYFAAHADDANALLAVGEQDVALTSKATEVASLTTMCQAILNLDAAIWKR